MHLSNQRLPGGAGLCTALEWSVMGVCIRKLACNAVDEELSDHSVRVAVGLPLLLLPPLLLLSMA